MTTKKTTVQIPTDLSNALKVIKTTRGLPNLQQVIVSLLLDHETVKRAMAYCEGAGQ